MIKSIEFTGEYGYISKKLEEPTKPVKRYFYKDSDKERYEKEMKSYQKKKRHYNKHKDDFANEKLAKNLLHRKFEFASDKINVIFGPNACGKTTIIKALAGNAMITDGFTQLAEPIDLGGFSNFLQTTKERFNEETVQKYIDSCKLNSCNIDWDGVPIYFQNFENRTSRSFGDMVGSILSDLSDEVNYIFHSKEISRGQNSIFIINRVIDIAKNPVTYDKLLESYKKKRCNDTWRNSYDAQIAHFMKYENANSGNPNTFLFDEVDKSLDINNTYLLYVNILPEIVKKYKNQIILVSHSPIILSEKIYNSDYYNIISIDEEYTAQCRENLAKLF